MTRMASRLFAGLTLACALAWSTLAPQSAQAQARPLNNIPVVGTVDAAAFTGRLTITELTLGEDGLLASGWVTGRAGRQRVVQQFTEQPVALIAGAGEAPLSSQPLGLAPDEPFVCDILFLDLAPLHLDLLGLELDLAQVVLDLDAVSGPGALLGNLLCAVTGLLDVVNVGVFLTGILETLLDAINSLL
jgi:hypothetical protein